MKRIISAILVVIGAISLFGCSKGKYELAWDGFCYYADSGDAINLDASDKRYIIDIFNDGEWKSTAPNCIYDYMFVTQRERIYYHSDCGVLYDTAGCVSLVLTDSERARVNAMLGAK